MRIAEHSHGRAPRDRGASSQAEAPGSRVGTSAGGAEPPGPPEAAEATAGRAASGAWPGSEVIAPGRAARAKRIVAAYLSLTKPRIIELLLVATIPAMLLADRGSVDASTVVLILSTLFGGWLGAAGAHTLNCVVDADIDKLMKRTAKRPLATDTVSTRQALVFGLALSAGSFLWLWLMVNLLSGLLIVATIAFYAIVYTKVLKRRTSQNVVWGGAAGCMPVMIGWAAVTGTIGWQAVVMFLIIFFWTPPHTWALGMKYKEDYAAAGVPMLPVVAEPQAVTRQIVLYTIATVLTTIALIPAAGLLYACGAVVVGAWFLTMAVQLHRGVKTGAQIKPLRLFIMSNNYLAALFLILAVDSVLGLQTVGSMIG